MKTRFLLVLFTLWIVTLTHAQRSVIISATKKYKVETVGQYEGTYPEPTDSFNPRRRIFIGHEKGGAICVNGIEKLELAFSTHKTLTAVSQLHFYGPLLTEGRIFTVADEQKNYHGTGHMHDRSRFFPGL